MIETPPPLALAFAHAPNLLPDDSENPSATPFVSGRLQIV